jgi:hypothetical protein
MLRRTDATLKSIGVVQSRLKHETVLVAGFAFGLQWKYAPRPTAKLDELVGLLGKLKLSLEQLRDLANDRERLNVVSERLLSERPGLEHWFKLGLWVFACTWILGSERYAPDTDTAQALLREDVEVRKACSSLLAALIDIGWSPDDAEKFYLDKVVPFLYDNDHRKWVDNPDMGVMSDLLHKAKQLDSQLSQDSDTRRITGATRALVAELPIVGKALEILIFGAKK